MYLNRVWLTALLFSALPVFTAAQTDLQVRFGNNGLQQVIYKGSLLEDVSGYPGDGFHIGHMKITDLGGRQLTGPQFDWGEENSGRNWNPSTHTWTYNFVWGSIAVQYVQNGNSLDMNVTARNNAGSGAIFDGAVIYPMALHFQQLPAGFGDSAYEHLAFNTTGPSVTVADFGAGQVASVLTDAEKPLYTGFEPAGPLFTYYPIISGTTLDNMATFFPRNDRPVAPGETDAFTVSLRFAPSGTPASAMAADAYQRWAQTWPQTLQWADRRIIGTAYLASSGSGPSTLPAGFPNNPRRYFNDGNAADFDIRSAAGMKSFQLRVLQQAYSNVSNLQRMNAQGLITWDIEGQEFPHSTSYACSPNQIAQIAPEMESTVTDSSSPYNGMKLDDAYFKIMRDAGFRIGVCIRPQHFTLYGNGTADQVFLPASQVASELTSKMKYAHDRWGDTLFYVDSSVDENGGPLDPAIFQQVAASLPDSLIMPEWSTSKYYAFTAPFQTFLFHTDLGTPSDIYNFYPRAFSVNLVNDVDAGKLAQYRSQLTESVHRGDILMLHADYWQDNNQTAVEIYQDAGVSTVPPPAITPVVPTPILDPTPAPAPPVVSGPIAITNVVFGAALSGGATIHSRIDAALDAAGSYLLVDGMFVSGYYLTPSGYTYDLDTTRFSNGFHFMQVWGHTINNDSLLSAPVFVSFSN